MMHLFINSLAASAGGGLTYIRNVVPHLAAKTGLRVTTALGRDLRKEFEAFTGMEFLEIEIPAGRRFWFEQSSLPELIRKSGADVLLSAGNFALRTSPVPQILLSRNSIYTSADFYRDLRARGEYRAWGDTRIRGWLAKKSIQWADITVAPSEAFAAELRQWTNMTVRAVHHGFDAGAFCSDTTPLPSDIEEKLKASDGCLKLLFVSHYNYYRNFETLFRALPLLRGRLSGRPVKLLLTCKLSKGENPGFYNPESAAALIKKLGITEMVVELGAVSYHRLHALYRRADIYVTPAYTETFAHPLVEAMASGVPVVASDLAVHHEICREAAAYFPKFSSEALADAVANVALSAPAAKRMAQAGLERSKDFSWAKHVDAILELSSTLVASKLARTV
jgi:glycosyltransferase involved in cell wall biosynthesis